MLSTLKDLEVFKQATDLAMRIFEISKSFPKEEKYSLTDQIRRSSRSVCANLGEAYRKRQYPAHFVSKLSDADMENTETQVWLSFALKCHYLSEEVYLSLMETSQSVGRILNHMIHNPLKFQRRKNT